MAVHKFPGRTKDHIDSFPRIVYKVSEDHSQTLQRVSFDVKEFVGVSLNNLQKHSHPLVEGLVETVFNKLVVNSISPADGSETEIEDVQHLLSSVAADLLVSKSTEDRREDTGHINIKMFKDNFCFNLLNQIYKGS